jgi:hypothetical protein
VQAEASVGRRVQRAVVDHADGPADALLGRLEDERHPAGQLRPRFSEQPGDGQQDGSVPVVAAGVVGGIDRRAIGLAPVGFGQGQSVHVGAEQNRSPGRTALEHAHDPRLANTGADLVDPQASQPTRNDVGRPVLLVRDLRVLVEVAS